MKLETRINKIINSDNEPRIIFLKLVGLAFDLVPNSPAQEKVRLLAEKYRQEYNITF